MSVPRQIRFRVLLPIVFLILSIALGAMGDWQLNKIRAYLDGGAVHGVPDGNARARYVDYAVNAPAWGTGEAVSDLLPLDLNWGRRKDIEVWTYRSFVILMWFLIGLRLDKRQEASPDGPFLGSKRFAWALRILGIVLGAWIFYASTRDGDATWGRVNEPWFIVSACAWGVGLVFASANPRSPSQSRISRVFYGVVCELAGAYGCYYAVLIYGLGMALGNTVTPAMSGHGASNPVPFGPGLNPWISGAVTVFIWGAALFAFGTWLLLKGQLPKSKENNVLRAGGAAVQ